MEFESGSSVFIYFIIHISLDPDPVNIKLEPGSGPNQTGFSPIQTDPGPVERLFNHSYFFIVKSYTALVLEKAWT